MFHYTLDSTNKLSQVTNYFLINPLIGQKNLILNKWIEAFKIIETKDHLSDNGFK